MSYVDKALTCSDCSTGFTFTASEQEFFATKGFTHDPGRCPECRAAKKVRTGGGYGNSNGNSNGGYRQQRDMHPAVCATCGTNTQVPFEPREGRPVYCSNCYTKTQR